MFENRRYVIIPVAEIALIDFSQVMEKDQESCRISLDGTKTLVKYEGDMPSSVGIVGGKSQEYTNAEILEILAGEEWTAPEAE